MIGGIARAGKGRAVGLGVAWLALAGPAAAAGSSAAAPAPSKSSAGRSSPGPSEPPAAVDPAESTAGDSSETAEPTGADSSAQEGESGPVAQGSLNQEGAAAALPASAELKRFTLALSLPVATYTRRRLSEEGSVTYRMTGVQGVFAAGPTLRGFFALSHWLHLGLQLSGGFSTVNVDGSPDTESLVTVGLDAAARVTPWAPKWGQPQLTLAVGGRYFDGYFIDESRPGTSITAFSPALSGDVGVVFWLLREVIGVELGAGAAYVFGPASFDAEAAGSGYLQQLDLSIESGLLARF